MSITVREAMGLDTFREFRLIAGERGLERPIDRSGILDYEYESHFEKGQFEKRSFIISSLLFAKGHPERILEGIKGLINDGVSGLAIKTVYYKELPPEVLEYADNEGFPLFLFDRGGAFFEDVITELSDRIRQTDQEEWAESRIELLVKNELGRRTVKETALEIHRSFKEEHFVVYCKSKTHIEDSIWRKKAEGLRKREPNDAGIGAFKYQKGLLLICTADKGKLKNPEQLYHDLLEKAGLSSQELWIGISRRYDHLEEVDRSIRESLYAELACEAEKRGSLSYTELGSYQLLIPEMERPWAKDFHYQRIERLIEQDKRHGTQLYETLQAFVDCEGDIPKTAETLFIHGNTVRYRIERISELLELSSGTGRFYEELFLAMRLEKLYRLK